MGGGMLELVDPERPDNKMRSLLPMGWRQMSEESFRELARAPETRFWRDPDGVFWRIAEIGPQTVHDFALSTRHLFFDSDQTWAGIVEFPGTSKLGDLASEALTSLRNGMRDLAGRRRHFRRSCRIA